MYILARQLHGADRGFLQQEKHPLVDREDPGFYWRNKRLICGLVPAVLCRKLNIDIVHTQLEGILHRSYTACSETGYML